LRGGESGARYLLEVGAGEPGHAEELDGVGARDAAVAICARASRAGQGRSGDRIESGRGAGGRGMGMRGGAGIGPESAKANHSE
jgi:hypothetical protein